MDKKTAKIIKTVKSNPCASPTGRIKDLSLNKYFIGIATKNKIIAEIPSKIPVILKILFIYYCLFLFKIKYPKIPPNNDAAKVPIFASKI